MSEISNMVKAVLFVTINQGHVIKYSHMVDPNSYTGTNFKFIQNIVILYA